MAKASYREGLRLWQEMQQVEQRLGIVKGLAGLAEIAAAQGQAERAGRLFGAASRLLPATSTYREEVHRRSAAARANLDAATFEAGWAAGQTMTGEQAVNFALQDAWLRRWPRSHTATHTIGKGAPPLPPTHTPPH